VGQTPNSKPWALRPLVLAGKGVRLCIENALGNCGVKREWVELRERARDEYQGGRHARVQGH